MKEENAHMIAPCGMNCGYCFAYLRQKNKCTGCRGCDDKKPKTRLTCKIKTCTFFADRTKKFCFECPQYPCKNLLHIDKRYRLRYCVSLIENQAHIKQYGIDQFLKEEQSRWQCSKCSGAVCLQKGTCYTCGYKKER